MSAPDVTPPVERLHRVLIDEIAKKQPHYLDRSFTVAEIYQSLVPYRSHRDAIGVQMNGDYEDALLRLLAGAGDLVVLESDSALGEIRRELESRNPNTGLFREFSDAVVRLNQDALPTSAPSEPQTVEIQALAPEQATSGELRSDTVEPLEAAAEAETLSPAQASSPVAEAPAPMVDPPPLEEVEAVTPVEASGFSILPAPEPSTSVGPGVADRLASSFVEADISPVPAAPAVETPSPAAAGTIHSGERSGRAGSEAASCYWCSEQLPVRESVNFCPHCGKSTQIKPCGGCSEEMELGWRFCATCGSESTIGFA